MIRLGLTAATENAKYYEENTRDHWQRAGKRWINSQVRGLYHKSRAKFRDVQLIMSGTRAMCTDVASVASISRRSMRLTAYIPQHQGGVRAGVYVGVDLVDSTIW